MFGRTCSPYKADLHGSHGLGFQESKDFKLRKDYEWNEARNGTNRSQLKGGGVRQTQCRRLPHEWGLGKGKTEASLPPAKSAEKLLRTHDLVTQ